LAVIKEAAAVIFKVRTLLKFAMYYVHITQNIAFLNDYNAKLCFFLHRFIDTTFCRLLHSFHALMSLGQWEEYLVCKNLLC